MTHWENCVVKTTVMPWYSISQTYQQVSTFGLFSKQDSKIIQSTQIWQVCWSGVCGLQNGTDPTDVKKSSKSSDLKPLHAREIVDWYDHVKKEKEIIKGFNYPRIWKAVPNAEDIYKKVENLFFFFFVINCKKVFRYCKNFIPSLN